MKEVIQVFGNYTIEWLVFVIVAFSVLGQASLKLYKAANNLHKKTDEYESIVELTYENSKNIETLSNIITKEQEMTNEFRIRSLADTLFVCYKNVKEQGYVTRRQLENFQDNVEMYRKLGGNGVVENKYIPEVMKMEVKE